MRPHAPSPASTSSRIAGSSYIQRATGCVKAGSTFPSSRSIRSMADADAIRRRCASIACRLRATSAITFSSAAVRSIRSKAVTVVPDTLNRASSFGSACGER